MKHLFYIDIIPWLAGGSKKPVSDYLPLKTHYMLYYYNILMYNLNEILVLHTYHISYGGGGSIKTVSDYPHLKIHIYAAFF